MVAAVTCMHDVHGLLWLKVSDELGVSKRVVTAEEHCHKDGQIDFCHRESLELIAHEMTLGVEVDCAILRLPLTHLLDLAAAPTVQPYVLT